MRASFQSGESLEWTRVHDLPDFVYFNHSIHIKKGVGCETCHGRIDQMQGIYQARSLQMEWCLDCHRAPEKCVRPRAAVFEMGYEPAGDQLEVGRRLVKEYQIQSRRPARRVTGERLGDSARSPRTFRARSPKHHERT